MIHEIVQKVDIVVKKIPFVENLVDSFTKTLTRRVFDGHKGSIGIGCILDLL